MNHFEVHTEFGYDVFEEYIEFCLARFSCFVYVRAAGLAAVLLALTNWYFLAEPLREELFALYFSGGLLILAAVFIFPYLWSFFSYRQQMATAAPPLFVFTEAGFLLVDIEDAWMNYAQLSACL